MLNNKNNIPSYIEPGTFLRIGKGQYKGLIGIVLPRDNSFDQPMHLRLSKTWSFVYVLKESTTCWIANEWATFIENEDSSD
jgi:hypothetical protein